MTKQQLIEDNMKLVYFIVQKYFPTYIQDEDIIQAGMLGLCKAADKWDEEVSQFSTFASKCIRNEIRLELRNRNKHKDVLSLDYEITDSDGDGVTLGEMIAGDKDIDYIDVSSVYKQLTPIEQKIFDLRCSGLSTRAIGRELGYSRTFVWDKLRHIKLLWKMINGYDEDNLSNLNK